MPSSVHRTILTTSIGLLVKFTFFYLCTFLSCTAGNVLFFSQQTTLLGIKQQQQQQQQQDNDNSSNQDGNNTKHRVKAQLLRNGSVVMRVAASSSSTTRVVFPTMPVTISCEEHNKSITHNNNDDDDDDDRYYEEEQSCTAQERSYQAATYCSIYMGRHNLIPFFPLLRLHMPEATLLVDVGANKGLVSSRWLELWRPELNQTALQHANFVRRYVLEHAPAGTHDAWCGVSHMCTKPNLVERAYLAQCAPVVPTTPLEGDPENAQAPQFEIYSFEPSPHLYIMQQMYMSTMASESLRAAWKWFPFAASDEVKQVHFAAKWNEGSQIIKGEGGATAAVNSSDNDKNAIWTVTLDLLAEHYPPRHHHQDDNNVKQVSNNSNSNHATNIPNLFGNRTIDILKIDAEGVDAAVLVGASHLLLQQRIRVMMWETPNFYPLHFPDDAFGGAAAAVTDFGQLIHRLDVYANMTCTFPVPKTK
jgi:FkbM family methyltransferase